MSQSAGKMLGISMTIKSRKKILEEIGKYLKTASSVKPRPLIIVTPNPEQIVYAQHDERFAGLLNEADVAIPDGIGVVWAMRFLGIAKNIQRIPGNELLVDLAGIAAKRGVRIGLIGAKGKIAVKAFECLKKTFPSLEGEARSAPEFTIVKNQLTSVNFEDFLAQTVRWIQEKKIQILFVGLGAPKQEYFMECIKYQVSSIKKNKNTTPDTLTHDTPLILMSVGGSFDILAGRVSRAPVFMRSIGFEWFWRLIREPWRFRRQLALVTFAYLVLRAKFRSTSK